MKVIFKVLFKKGGQEICGFQKLERTFAEEEEEATNGTWSDYNY